MEKKLKIIGFSGKARYGKTTCANICEKILNQKYPELKCGVYPLAATLKEQAKKLGWDGAKDDKGRRLLQELSWPIKHYFGDEIYAKWLIQKANEDEVNIVLCDDVRMLAEVNYFTENEDPVFVRIERPGFESDLTEEQKNDISETQLDNYDFKYYLINDGDLNDLKKKLEKLIELIL